MTSNAPHRKHVLKIEIGADSKEAMIGVLNHIEFLLGSDQISDMVSGGYDSGFTANYSVDESITHDSYIESINSWLEQRKVTSE